MNCPTNSNTQLSKNPEAEFFVLRRYFITYHHGYWFVIVLSHHIGRNFWASLRFNSTLLFLPFALAAKWIFLCYREILMLMGLGILTAKQLLYHLLHRNGRHFRSNIIVFITYCLTAIVLNNDEVKRNIRRNHYISSIDLMIKSQDFLKTTHYIWRYLNFWALL